MNISQIKLDYAKIRDLSRSIGKCEHKEYTIAISGTHNEDINRKENKADLKILRETRDLIIKKYETFFKDIMFDMPFDGASPFEDFLLVVIRMEENYC